MYTVKCYNMEEPEENTMLSERNQTQKNTYFDSTAKKCSE